MNRNLPLILLVGIFLTGCQQDDTIKTYRLAKESAQPTSVAMAPSMTPAASTKEIDWNVPSGWKEQPASTMRVGSFLVLGENGQQADVSVIPLSGMAGGDLANVNRWRDQIELPPLTEAQLPQNSQTLKINGQSVTMVNFVSAKLLIDGKRKKRVIAAALPQGPRTWFFKITGDDQTVQTARDQFIEFLTSIRLKDGRST